MAVRITKPAVNFREKLAELERPIGVNGAALMATSTPQDAFSLIGARNRNRIINGDMRIDQRNAQAGMTPSGDGTYTVDRWNARNTQASKYTIQQVSDAPAGFVNSFKVTSSSAYSVTSTDYFAVDQYIEGLNSSDLAWGTANAKTVTLSFWVKSSLTGTFGGSVFGYQVGPPSYIFSYAINSANTWEYKTVTIPGPTSGTFVTTSAGNIAIEFSFGVGSSLSTTAGSWNSSTLYRSATGAVSVVGTSAATWQITGVQFEEGKVATPFEYRAYGQELALCQRYYFDLRPSSGTSVYPTTVESSGTDRWYTVIKLPVTMRATPTLNAPGTYTGTSNIRLNWPFPGSTLLSAITGVYNVSPDAFTLYGTKTSSFAAAGNMVGLEIASALTSTIGAQAEL